MKHIIGLVTVVVLSLLILQGCAPLPQEPGVSSSSLSSTENVRFKECQDKSSEANTMDVYAVSEDCLDSKAQSVQDCNAYEGKTIYRWTNVERKFGHDAVKKCIYALALRTNNVDICDQTGEQTQSCYDVLAVQEKSLSICTRSPQPKNCHLYYIGGLGIDTECQKLPQHLVNIISCFFEKAEKAGLTNQQLGEMRTDVCSMYPNLETIAGDKESICTAAFGAYTKDTTLCNNAGKFKADCYSALAINSPKFTLKDCDKAGTDYVGCYNTIAVRDSDVSFCSQLPEGNKLDCITQVAIKTKKLSLCAQVKISDNNQGIQCAQGVLNQITPQGYTYDFCDTLSKIGNVGIVTPNQCFYELGIRDLDLKSCDRIQGEDTSKEECKTRVGHALNSK